MDLVRARPFSEQLPPRKRPRLVIGIGNGADGRSSATTTMHLYHPPIRPGAATLETNNENATQPDFVVTQQSRHHHHEQQQQEQQPTQWKFHNQLTPPQSARVLPFGTSFVATDSRNQVSVAPTSHTTINRTATTTSTRCESPSWDWWKKRRDPPSPRKQPQHPQRPTAETRSTRPSRSSSCCFICQLSLQPWSGSSDDGTTTTSRISQATIQSRDRQHQENEEIMPRNSLHKYFSSSRCKECDVDMERENPRPSLGAARPPQPLPQHFAAQPTGRDVMPRNALHKYFSPKLPLPRPDASTVVITDNMMEESTVATVLPLHQADKEEKKSDLIHDYGGSNTIVTYECSVCNSCQHCLCPSCTFYCRVCGESYCTFCCRGMDQLDGQAAGEATPVAGLIQLQYDHPPRRRHSWRGEDEGHVCYGCVPQHYDGNCHRWTSSSSTATLVHGSMQSSLGNSASSCLHEEEDNNSRMSIE